VALSDEVMTRLTDVNTADRAALLAQAAEFRGARYSPAAGLELLEEAIALYSTLPPTAGYVQALRRQPNLLRALGRLDDAYRAARAAAEAAQRLGLPQWHRRMLAQLAWYEARAGDVDRGLRTLDAAYALVPPASDPVGDIWIAISHTDILLRSGGSADEVERVGTPALSVAARSGIATNWQTNLVRSNISEALTRAGFISRAAAWIDPMTERPFDIDRWPLHLERFHLDVLRGRLDAARGRLAPLRDNKTSILYQSDIETRAELINYLALVDLWDDAPDQALALTRSLLEVPLSTEADAPVARTFVLAARAAADLLEHDPRTRRGRDRYLRNLHDLHARAAADPFTTTDRVDGRAHGAAWQAETARLAGQPKLELWATAAREWDELSRPQDAAYCRWRGAQVAIATGQGTIALRLLRRAAREAREHVPLSTAIAETTERARRSPHPG
jgi:tetratricopeptide (TPR) repeat protein